jgi:single-strand DNA-binding protein
MADYASLNFVVLVGYIASQTEHGRAKNNAEWIRFRLATNELFADGKKHAEFHEVVAWGKKAALIYKWAVKGKCVQIIGKLRHEEYRGDDGMRKSKTYVAVEQFTWMGRRKDFPEIMRELDEQGEEEDEPI